MRARPGTVPQLVKTLRRTYARKLGEIAAGADDDALRADLEHLAAVIRMFWPGEDFAAIKPIRPRANRRGSKAPVWFLSALDVLREAEEPLTAQEIVRRILRARGEAVEGAVAKSAECSVLAAFRRRGAALGIERVGAQRPFNWMIARR